MKPAWLVLPLLGAAAGPSSPAEPEIAVTGALFALSVPDLEASSRWCQETLGLTAAPGVADPMLIQMLGV